MKLNVIYLPTILLGLMSGCAEERAPINRVQANALDKAFFVGADLQSPGDDPQFYWRNYVVDGSVSQSLVGVGTWSGVERIRWEVTEDKLIAHRGYQWLKGSDGRAKLENRPDGTIVAAFKISKHFDIRRDYNPSTGEALNVIVENGGDLPWQQRKYMRVDWSQNLIDSPLWADIFIGKMFGDIEVDPVSYYVSDPSHPDAPHFEMSEGYFDITTKYYIAPAQSNYFGGMPTCVVVGFFTGSATYECDPQEATVRSSFLRVDPEHDFESLELTTAQLDVVGNPAGIDPSGMLTGMVPPGEQGWDPGYGFTDALHRRFAHVHNIWKRSHLEASCSSDLDADSDGTSDECAASAIGYDGSAGSQCDELIGKCTVPYRDREVRTVTYFVNDLMPAELQTPLEQAEGEGLRGASEDVIHAWDQLLKNSVAQAREVECRRTGGERDACHSTFFEAGDEMVSYGAWLIGRVSDPSTVLAMCHNPVRADDHEACGAEGYKARLGDIRHNFMAYWPHASRARYGGIGNWGADPLTGEIRGAAAMIMGRSTTRAAAYQRDVIQLALGDITIEQITNGEPADSYASYLREGKAPQALSTAEIARRVASIDAEQALSTVMPRPIAGTSVVDKIGTLNEIMASSTADVERFSAAQLEFEAASRGLHGSLEEAQLVEGQWMTSVAGLSPDGQPDGEAVAQVSPFQGMDPGAHQAMQHRLHAAMETRGVCFSDLEAPTMGSANLASLAGHFRALYPDDKFSPEERGERIYHDLWVESFKGIAIHEVGHSLGLLHNFASSWDAPNYNPQYWQLRTHEGASTASCQGKPRQGNLATVAEDGCMGPRYLDPPTADEQGLDGESRPGVTYFGNTSVMEYASERFGETVGLGQYDAHAMKALYGRVLETFESAERGGVADATVFAPRLGSQLGEDDRMVRNTAPFEGQIFPKPTHYTTLAVEMNIFDASRCREATEEEKAQGGWRIVHGKVCAPAPRDHAAWRDFEHAPAWSGWPDQIAPYVQTRADSPAGERRIRWHYRYGTSNNSYFHTQSGDAGADPYEVTMSTIETYDSAYPWRYFRRGNREFFSDRLPFAASSRTFQRLRAYHWNAANRNALYRSLGLPVWEEISQSDEWHRPLLIAETEMFNALARTVLMPEPGRYGALEQQPVGSSSTIYDAGSPNSSFEVGLVDGRFIGQSFDSGPDAGGSWNYLHWMEHAGFGVEKVYASMALSDGRPVLATISRDNYLDGRAVKINFRSDMPLALDRLLGGVLAEDWETVGMYVGSGSAPIPQMTPITSVDQAPVRPAGAKVLFPNIGYRQQLGMLMSAHVYASMNTDMALSNKLRLWVDGQTGQVTIPEAQQVRFYDEVSGYTYVARRYGDDLIAGKVVDLGIASRMIAHANKLVIEVYEVVRDDEGAALLDPFGAPTLLTDAAGQPLEKDDSAARKGELRRYVGLMDAARQIAEKVGQGPLR